MGSLHVTGECVTSTGDLYSKLKATLISKISLFWVFFARPEHSWSEEEVFT